MKIPVRLDLEHPDLIAGLVEARGVTVRDSDERLAGLIEEAIAAHRARPGNETDDRKKRIRDLLRFGNFKPAGRNKPASEYIATCAVEGDFPAVNNIVDSNNLVSLRYALPISVVDFDLALGGADAPGLVIRFGRERESYIFNRSGQEIDITGLICLAREGGDALANPVKDSMASKTHDGTKNVLGVIYASAAAGGLAGLREATELFAELLREHADASTVLTRILPDQ